MVFNLPSKEPKPLEKGFYKIDFFNKKPLFFVQDKNKKNSYIVKEWEQAFAIHGSPNISDINKKYIASIISDKPLADISPYKLIERIPRSHNLIIGKNNELDICFNKPFQTFSTRMEERKLHEFIRNYFISKINSKLPKDVNIGCEFSSGLDSNAIIGILVKAIGINPDRIFTSTTDLCDEGNKTKQLRKEYKLIDTNCKIYGHADVSNLSDNNRIIQLIELLGAPPQFTSLYPFELENFHEKKCKVVFSGFGGDQALSHNALNVPSDLLNERKFLSAYKWFNCNKSSFIKYFVKKFIYKYKINLFRKNSYKNKIIFKTLTEEGKNSFLPHVIKRETYERNIYIPLKNSILNRVSGDWISVRREEECRLAKKFQINKIFPYLDEFMISTLLQQDYILFGDNLLNRRQIHRMSFYEYLPKLIRNNPNKNNFLTDETFKVAYSQQLKNLILTFENFKNTHSLVRNWWDVKKLIFLAEKIINKTETKFENILELNNCFDKINLINEWLKMID